jgi:hypothetical protein
VANPIKMFLDTSARRINGETKHRISEDGAIGSPCPSMSQLADPDMNRRLAYHEAGHAVMAFVVGAKIEYVTIESAVTEVTGPAFGHTKCLDLDQKPVEAFVMVALAGSLAEAREMGDAGSWARLDERRRAKKLIRIATLQGKRKGPPTITPDEEAAVSAYLEQYWPAVVAVASALLKTPRLRGDAVPDLAKGAVPPGGHI